MKAITMGKTVAGIFGLCVLAAASAKAVPITVIDLSGGAPASGTANGAIFSANSPQPTGTGVIDPFLREQNTPSETGINTSISSPPLDDKPGPWTHDLTVGQLSTVTSHGVDYYKFSLDANQEANAPISLTTFKIFVTSGSPFTTASALTGMISSGTNLRFDMNGGVTQYRVDITSQNGSGSGDMSVLVPKSAIGTSGNLYLYAGFGVDANGNGYASNDGYEEWYAQEGGNFTVPDGGMTLALLGTSFCGLGLFARRRK